MNLSLQPTASSVILTVLVMAAGIWMSYIACKRNRRPLTFKLEILRLAILGFICFLLFQPEWLITSSPQEKPKVSILEDRSGSMETQDVEISPQHVVTRTAYVQELLKGNSTESLKDTHVVEYASFGASPAPDSPDYAMAGTDLAKPLEDAMQSSDNLRAVIMFTDGSHNAHGMRATVQSLRDRFPGQKFVFLVSIMADKDVDQMLSLLAPLAVRFVTVAAHTPRAMPAETLAEHIRAYGCRAEAAASIEAGVARAVELGGEGPVCALGTLYFSGDVRKAFAELVKG